MPFIFSIVFIQIITIQHVPSCISREKVTNEIFRIMVLKLISIVYKMLLLDSVDLFISLRYILHPQLASINLSKCIL